MLEKVNLILKINDYLNKNSIQKNHLRLSTADKQNLLLKHLNFKNDSDELMILFVKDTIVKIEIATWDESYHNGSYYNHKFHYFAITDEICDLVLSDLQEQYEKQEFNRLLAEENKIRDDAIRAKIVPVYQKFSQN